MFGCREKVGTAVAGVAGGSGASVAGPVGKDHISPFIILCQAFKPTTFLAGRSARVIDGFN